MGVRSETFIGDTEEFRSLVSRSKISPSRFATVMGASPSTVQQYLSGRRQVPRVAIAAARWTLLVLGIRVEVSGGELARLTPGRSRLGGNDEKGRRQAPRGR